MTLTHGSPVGLPAVLLNLDPSLGSYTGISCTSGGEAVWIGQMAYKLGHRSARMTYIISEDASDTRALPFLVEGLVAQAGSWGAFNILAEVDEHSNVFESLRQSGFFVYSRQTVWCITDLPGDGKQNGMGKWQTAGPDDTLAVRSLYNCLVPPLVQSAEQHSPALNGLIYCQDGEVLAYVEGVFGPRGIYLLPVLHPSLDNVPALLNALVQRFTPSRQRPVYLGVRSYQAWLEPVLEEMNAHVSPRQALLVKHLSQVVREPAVNGRRVVIENRTAEATTPIMPHYFQTVEPPGSVGQYRDN